MALSPDELAQIRDVVRGELNMRPAGTWTAAKIAFIAIVCFVNLFLAVLMLHVLVIGGFTIWHLMHPSN
jgi:hypothetical protein